MHDAPFSFDISRPGMSPSRYDKHTIRRLSSMRGQFLDEERYAEILTNADPILYEVYEIQRPHTPGELLHGISVIHPGKVGSEYFMTKGHFHAVLETAEVYYCLAGEGKMVLETPEGEWAVEEFSPGRVLYVPPRWAHRSVNTSLSVDLIFLFVYPGNAGHNYETIEKQGFRKLVIEQAGTSTVVDNPRWVPPQAR